MDKTKKKIEDNQINHNILNALNLMHEDLGDCYTQEGFNPFGENFELSEDFIIERLANSKNNPELKTPQFVENGTKAFKTALENNIANCTNVLDLADALVLDTNLTPALKEELKKLKTYLLCRVQLSNKYLKSLKKQKNTFKMYKNITQMHNKNAEFFEEAYAQQFNAQIALTAFLNFAKENSVAYKKELASNALKQKAAQILKQNQAKQATEKKQALAQTKQIAKESTTKKAAPKTTKQTAQKEKATKQTTKVSKEVERDM